MNKVYLTGRLTKDVDLRYAPSGTAVARFSMALDRGKDKDGNDRGADFPNCVAFGRTAENIEKFSGKGLRIAVDGHLTTGSYEKDGHKVYTTDVTVDRAEIIDWKGNAQAQPHEQTAMPDNFEALNEDVPF